MAVAIGVPVGLVAGYYGGRIDDGLMRIADVMLAFPALVLALALIGVFGESPFYVPDPIVRAGLAEGCPNRYRSRNCDDRRRPRHLGMVRAGRPRRGTVDPERRVRQGGTQLRASNRTILLKHVLPNSLTPIIVLATIQVAVIILLEASLAYLGFSGTTLSWGTRSNEARTSSEPDLGSRCFRGSGSSWQ